MEWTIPGEYTRSKVDKVGNIIIGKKIIGNAKDKEEAFEIFNNWRASHSYPMHIIMNTLKKISEKINPDAICVRRLKRSKSIIYKLKRYNAMKLSTIQDIGGCRVVMPNVKLARKVSRAYISSKLKHKRVKARESNYINNPKPDGYRSIHLVYEFNSTNKGKEVFNGKLIEIQIRSNLQHIWSTALETVDLFTSQTMKFGGGKESWRYFFKLVSSAFAKIEQCPVVDGTPTDKKELYSEIKRMAKELNVFEKMNAWRAIMEHMKSKKNSSLFLLKLDLIKKVIQIIPYKNDSQSREKANRDYALEEEKYRNDEKHDVVLVGAENIKDLKYGYLNYYADTEEFLKYLFQIIEEKI